MAKRISKQQAQRERKVDPQRSSVSKRGQFMPFDRQNYFLLLICVGLIVFGYTIMRMDNQVEGFISLYLAPLILLAGYLGVIYAIMKRPRHEEKSSV